MANQNDDLMMLKSAKQSYIGNIRTAIDLLKASIRQHQIGAISDSENELNQAALYIRKAERSAAKASALNAGNKKAPTGEGGRSDGLSDGLTRGLHNE